MSSDRIKQAFSFYSDITVGGGVMVGPRLYCAEHWLANELALLEEVAKLKIWRSCAMILLYP